MRLSKRVVLVFTAMLMCSIFPFLTARPAYAADEPRCFPETGQCISGDFRRYWERNGGLAIFGYPIAPARSELNRESGQPYLTQWFERNRFELHPENPAPYNVLLGRLGDDVLRQRGVDWRTLPGANNLDPGDCLVFRETDHVVCDQLPGLGFKTYWLTHGLRDPQLDAYGRSLALFGLPLTEATIEINPADGKRYLTQWFERGRFEWHPENPNEYKVLLGLLGNELSGPPLTSRSLMYLWPRAIPAGLVVLPDRSFADETAFALELVDPSGGQPSAGIAGGAGVLPPPKQGSTPITVRGQRGLQFTTGAGVSIYWVEGGQPYAVRGDMVDALKLAENLEALDLPAWRKRLDQAGRQPREIIVDDRSPGFAIDGAWQEDVARGYNGHMYYACANGTSGKTQASWQTKLPGTGWYEVYAFVPDYHSNTVNARYTVVYRDGETVVGMAQQPHANQWISLGTFRFEGSGAVHLSDATGEPPSCKTQVAFDAVKWVPR